MRHRRRGGHNYKFTEKTHSVRGVFAIILALLSIIACAWFIFYSFDNGGNVGIYLGSAGFGGFFVAVLSFAVAVSSVREPDKFRTLPYASLGVSIVSVFIWIALYLGGI